MKKYLLLLPLALVLVVIVILWRGLNLHPSEIPSTLIGQYIPTVDLPTFNSKKNLTRKDFIGHVTLLNVWATWCSSCEDEHDFLVKLSKELVKNKNIKFYGLDYKDDPRSARKWLQRKGNPYNIVALDFDGKAAIDWGVYGTPETFVIDKQGVIRYKQTGMITPSVWETVIKPLVLQLENETVKSTA